jgi:hypothetical protein
VPDVIAFLSVSECIVAKTLKKEYHLKEEINISRTIKDSK